MSAFWKFGPSAAGNAPAIKAKFRIGLATINQEPWLVLSLFLIAGLFNWLAASHPTILGLSTLPTVFSAYHYGRRHAVLTASASTFCSHVKRHTAFQFRSDSRSG